MVNPAWPVPSLCSATLGSPCAQMGGTLGCICPKTFCPITGHILWSPSPWETPPKSCGGDTFYFTLNKGDQNPYSSWAWCWGVLRLGVRMQWSSMAQHGTTWWPGTS